MIQKDMENKKPKIGWVVYEVSSDEYIPDVVVYEAFSEDVARRYVLNISSDDSPYSYRIGTFRR